MKSHGKAKPYRNVRRQSRNTFIAGSVSMLPSELRRLLFASLLVFSALSTTTMAQRRKAIVDLIIRGGTVVTMDSERRVIENGAVAVKAGRIVSVGSATDINGTYT